MAYEWDGEAHMIHIRVTGKVLNRKNDTPVGPFSAHCCRPCHGNPNNIPKNFYGSEIFWVNQSILNSNLKV